MPGKRIISVILASLAILCTLLRTPVAAQQLPEEQHKQLTPAQQRLKAFRTMFVYSDTVYLDSSVLRGALTKRFEINAWKITLADKDSADVRIKVTRPTFTFDWRWRMTDAATDLELASGRIVAWDGKRAADSLAADIARTIGRVRALPTHLVAALADEPNARKWQLTYQRGSEGPRKGVNLLVTVSPERIVGRRQSRVVFVIPAHAVSGVGYNPVVTNATKGWEAFWDSAFSSVGDDPNAAAGALMLLPVVLGGEAILMGFNRTEHLCEISWVDDGTVRSVEFKGETRQQVEQFLAAVQEVSHRKAVDMEAEAEAVRQALERENEAGRFISLQLDKKLAVGWKTVGPGAVRVIVAERPSQGAVAYFLNANAGGASPEVAAQLPVVIEPGVPQQEGTQVRYGETNRIATIEEIVTADRKLRFPAIPLRLATEPQVSEDMEELLAEAALKPKYRTIQVKSDTVYLKTPAMERALTDHPKFAGWDMKIVQHAEEAELLLVVKRPFLTFDWTYTVTEVKTGKKLADGRITARDGGKAASTIADQLVNTLKAQAAREIKNEVE